MINITWSGVWGGEGGGGFIDNILCNAHKVFTHPGNLVLAFVDMLLEWCRDLQQSHCYRQQLQRDFIV